MRDRKVVRCDELMDQFLILKKEIQKITRGQIAEEEEDFDADWFPEDKQAAVLFI
jgi:hypothetical protein